MVNWKLSTQSHIFPNRGLNRTIDEFSILQCGAPLAEIENTCKVGASE